MYKDIIYHHRVIKTDSLLQSCIENIISDYLSEKIVVEDNIKLQYILPYDISALWKAIKLASSNTRYFNSLIQWDDGLLFTILKKHYFMDYYQHDISTKFQLEELLSNKKHYYSLIKNNTDFEILNKGFEEVFLNHSINEDIHFMKIKNNKFSNNVSMMYIFENYFESLYKGIFNFKEFIKKNCKKFILNNYNNDIEDSIIVFKAISSGLNVEPSLYKNDELVFFTKFSNIKRLLESEKYTMSFVYIYLKFKKNTNTLQNKEFYKEFLKLLGKYLANKTKEYLDKFNTEGDNKNV